MNRDKIIHEVHLSNMCFLKSLESKSRN